MNRKFGESIAWTIIFMLLNILIGFESIVLVALALILVNTGK